MTIYPGVIWALFFSSDELSNMPKETVWDVKKLVEDLPFILDEVDLLDVPVTTSNLMLAMRAFYVRCLEKGNTSELSLILYGTTVDDAESSVLAAIHAVEAYSILWTSLRDSDEIQSQYPSMRMVDLIHREPIVFFGLTQWRDIVDNTDWKSVPVTSVDIWKKLSASRGFQGVDNSAWKHLKSMVLNLPDVKRLAEEAGVDLVENVFLKLHTIDEDY